MVSFLSRSALPPLPHGHFDVAVCSPGELDPRWIVVFVTVTVSRSLSP
ncbi:hypothetical protein [Klebsiella pneumoniae]